jgi:hypothetical protein
VSSALTKLSEHELHRDETSYSQTSMPLLIFVCNGSSSLNNPNALSQPSNLVDVKKLADRGMMGDAQTKTINASMLTSVQNADRQPKKFQPVNSLTNNNLLSVVIPPLSSWTHAL